MLGGYGVEVDGRPVPRAAWRQRRAAELVELLALEPRHRLHRDQVLDALWPHLSPSAGACNLYKAAHFARRTLRAAEAVALRGGYVELWPGADIATDVAAFETEARRALVFGDPASCRTAATLYSGDLLPDERYEDWACHPREQLRRLLVDVLRRGKFWQEVVEQEPSDELAHRALMREHAARGDRSAAVRQFHDLSTALRGQLGLDPSAESVALYREIVIADEPRAVAASDDGARKVPGRSAP
jgi:DNA-binding SARP family transcriptional activator